MSREDHLVELVSPAGKPLGTATVADAHTAPGALHRAFSVLLVDPQGRTLLQRRAAVKTRFPLRWANTCCGHPAPGEDVVNAASRRLSEEVGLRADGLTEVGVYAYRAVDLGTGRVEYEYDHVLIGQIPPDVRMTPDPQEVAEMGWVSKDELRDDLQASPDKYAPWLDGVAKVARSSGIWPELP